MIDVDRMIDSYEYNREAMVAAYRKLKEQNERHRKALKKIAKDFGTDNCDGNTMIAQEALDDWREFKKSL